METAEPFTTSYPAPLYEVAHISAYKGIPRARQAAEAVLRFAKWQASARATSRYAQNGTQPKPDGTTIQQAYDAR